MNLENFSYKGDLITFTEITGEVLDSTKESVTKVSSSGGAPVPFMGNTQLKVHSRVVSTHDFWIRTDDGLEKSIRLSGDGLMLRPGQKITLVYASPGSRSASPYLCYVLNHASGQLSFISLELDQISLYGVSFLSVVLTGGKALLYGAIVGIVMGSLLKSVLVKLLGFGLTTWWVITPRVREARAYKNAFCGSLDLHLAMLNKEILAHYRVGETGLTPPLA